MRLIDADALMDKTDDRYSLGEIGRRERDDIINALEFAPTIKPESRKKGKWIEQDAGGDGVFYECSVCKDAFTLMDGTPSDNNYNFCPNCGADMRDSFTIPTEIIESVIGYDD